MATDTGDKLKKLRAWTKKFNDALGELTFDDNVAYVYNPLEYAGAIYFEYWRRYGLNAKKTVFLGMNPGPFGMAQTGIPFGEISMVRDWMGLEGAVQKPAREHPKRPVQGFACPRSEVSGRRLWGYFSEIYPNAEGFFNKHFVLNYCPLVFMSETGANITPDKLKAETRAKLEALCDAYLAKCLELLNPDYAIGVGGFAYDRLASIKADFKLNYEVRKILHPSPASPAANRDWSGQVKKSLAADGLVL
jgi:single-strand selective monofunctional uracil DNA glycosylase